MPRQVSEFSPSERMKVDELKARHDAEKAKENARVARRDAKRKQENEQAAQDNPKEVKIPGTQSGDRVRRSPSKVKESPKPSGEKLHHVATKDDKKRRQLSKDIDAAERLSKELKTPQRAPSKDGEKHRHILNKDKELSRQGSGKSSSKAPRAPTEREMFTPSPSLLRAATSAQRPSRRSNGASSLEAMATNTEGPRQQKPASKTKAEPSPLTRSVTVSNVPPHAKSVSKEASLEMACRPRPRKLSVVGEMPGSFTDFTESTPTLSSCPTGAIFNGASSSSAISSGGAACSCCQRGTEGTVPCQRAAYQH